MVIYLNVLVIKKSKVNYRTKNIDNQANDNLNKLIKKFVDALKYIVAVYLILEVFYDQYFCP